MPAAYISFFADVNPTTSAALVGNIFHQVNTGATEIHILISTPGGGVDHGVEDKCNIEIAHTF
jgi:hypothetical protein